MPDSPAQSVSEDDLPDLLREAKSGSQEAIGMLLERHRSYLWALANEEIAGESHLTFTVADIVQSAQLEALLPWNAKAALDAAAAQTDAELAA